MRAAGAAVLLMVVLAGCDRGPRKADYDHPVPGCDQFQTVVEGLGMPDPQVQPGVVPSGAANSRDCTFVTGDTGQGAAVASASILVVRPEVKTTETDPAKLFGDDTTAAGPQCTGRSEDDPAVPAGKRCTQLLGEHQALVVVTTFAKSAAIRVDVRYFDPDRDGTAVRLATQDKASSLARSTIGLL
jgi:hypothetical protein